MRYYSVHRERRSQIIQRYSTKPIRYITVKPFFYII